MVSNAGGSSAGKPPAQDARMSAIAQPTSLAALVFGGSRGIGAGSEDGYMTGSSLTLDGGWVV
jgi:hypothetical protein